MRADRRFKGSAHPTFWTSNSNSCASSGSSRLSRKSHFVSPWPVAQGDCESHSPMRFIVSGAKPSSTLIVTPSRPLSKRKSNMLLIDYSRQFAITDAESIKEYCGPGDPDIGVFREFVNARHASADGSESGASTSGPKSNYVSLGKSRFRKRPPKEANFRAREHSDDTNTYSG